MYKILIVEDEQNAREGLMDLIYTHDPSIELLACTDGLEGYQTALKTSPDLIISDIRMPRQDGITMAKKLRQKQFAGEIFLLTGYADFSYAQQAIRYGVSEYILKPIVPGEFLQSLERALQKAVRKNTANGQETPNITYLFSGQDDMAMKDRLLHLQYTECFFAALYISGSSHLPPQAKELLLLETDLYMAYLPDKQFRGIYIGFRGNSVNHTAIAKLELLLKEYKNIVCVYTILNLHKVNSIIAIMEKLQEAVIWSITYPSRFINYSSAMHEKKELYQEDDHIKSELQRLQYRHSYKEYGNLLLKYLEAMREKRAHPLSIRMTAVSGLIKMGAEQSYFLAVENLSRAKTFQEIKVCIQNYFAEEKDAAIGYSKIVTQTIREINKYYAEPLSLNSVAKKLKITPQYLSKLFMQETGTTFVNYLTALRIEKAKLLLKNTNQRINLICRQIGYPDPKYFCTLFKKQVGVTPNQYRSNHL